MSKYDLKDDMGDYEGDCEIRNNIPNKHRKKRKDKKKYTQDELRDLMGVDRDIYKRKNRRVRRK